MTFNDGLSARCLPGLSLAAYCRRVLHLCHAVAVATAGAPPPSSFFTLGTYSSGPRQKGESERTFNGIIAMGFTVKHVT